MTDMRLAFRLASIALIGLAPATSIVAQESPCDEAQTVVVIEPLNPIGEIPGQDGAARPPAVEAVTLPDGQQVFEFALAIVDYSTGNPVVYGRTNLDEVPGIDDLADRIAWWVIPVLSSPAGAVAGFRGRVDVENLLAGALLTVVTDPPAQHTVEAAVLRIPARSMTGAFPAVSAIVGAAASLDEEEVGRGFYNPAVKLVASDASTACRASHNSPTSILFVRDLGSLDL